MAEKQTILGLGIKPVPMKLFATWEVDRTPSNCIPRYVGAVSRQPGSIKVGNGRQPGAEPVCGGGGDGRGSGVACRPPKPATLAPLLPEAVNWYRLAWRYHYGCRNYVISR
ncbi:uncharacterized protein LOC123519086 [Portunus trituberculatus]|uniref:uncharacterized protein LOC123519086 n=1 Tax=Portunus trituberculatus TaxID=210409 RepID=UPI001E1CC745|nr:uncharacterized protein LOC123519086 [Portunus trituberculatus]